MENYDFCPPEKKEWCVPAALQTILRKRKINMSQRDISEKFPECFKEGISTGFRFSEKLLQKFFRENNLELDCRFLNPFADFELYHSTDLFLGEIKYGINDALVGYDSELQQTKSNEEQIPHISVFLDYSVKSDLVRVTGIGKRPYEDISLPLLIDNMHPDKNPSYGFYVIKEN